MYANGELIPNNKGKPGTFTNKHHTKESIEKIRISTLEYIEKAKGKVSPRFNVNACKYMDELNIKNNWNLQHAQNGGEFSTNGYFLDGYDKDLNIVFEYDEPAHYKDVYNNILTDRDVSRM